MKPNIKSVVDRLATAWLTFAVVTSLLAWAEQPTTWGMVITSMVLGVVALAVSVVLEPEQE